MEERENGHTNKQKRTVLRKELSTHKKGGGGRRGRGATAPPTQPTHSHGAPTTFSVFCAKEKNNKNQLLFILPLPPSLPPPSFCVWKELFAHTARGAPSQASSPIAAHTKRREGRERKKEATSPLHSFTEGTPRWMPRSPAVPPPETEKERPRS